MPHTATCSQIASRAAHFIFKNSDVQALAARLVEGVVLPLLATGGQFTVLRTIGDAGPSEEALHWSQGGDMTVENALLNFLTFLAGALRRAPPAGVCI